METSAAMDARARIGLALLLAAAFVLRLGSFLANPGVLHPDEVFQYLEPAHRAVFGQGLMAWEWRVGARSWLLPGLVLPLVGAQRALGFGPGALHVAIAALLSALALPGVAAAGALGRRAAGPAAGWLAAVLAAGWFQLVYPAAHLLPDTLAADLLPVALWRAGTAATPRTHAAAGLLWGLLLAVRVQLAPAVGLGVLITTLPRRDALAWQAAGLAGATLLLSGVLDWATFGAPFATVAAYLRWNTVGGAADYFGTLPWTEYAADLVHEWGWAAPAVAIALALGLRRAWRPAVLAAAIVGAFSAVGHKEMRFILPALPLLAIVMATGTAVLLARLPRRAWVAAACLWLAVSAVLAGRPRFHDQWRIGTAAIAAEHAAAARPEICGLGVLPSAELAGTGGYAHARPGMTLHPADPGVDSGGFNAVMAADGARPAGFARRACWRDNPAKPSREWCLWQRPGGCAPGRSPPAALALPPFVPPGLARPGAD